MKVCELMGPKVVTVGLKRPLREILQLMLRYHLNDILIVDSEQKHSMPLRRCPPAGLVPDGHGSIYIGRASLTKGRRLQPG
jgi:CBS domain-containing protein